MTAIAGVAGGCPSMGVGQASPPGAPAPPSKVAGATGNATQAGGSVVQNAVSVAGGGSSIAAALEAVVAAVKLLSDTIARPGILGGGGAPAGGGCAMAAGHVMGVQGTAAAATQFVAAQVAAPAAASSGEDDDFEAKVLALVNQERAAYGLAPVTYNVTLDGAAEKHANHMAIVGQMAHDGIGDGDPGERIRAEGFRNAWGENVATGQTSPEQVVREWMASPLHRKNILDASFTQMGVGYLTATNGRTYWAQEFGA